MVTKKNSRSPWAWIPTLYFAEGLPNVIVTALSVVMYMQLGLTDAEVGLYTGWLALPWVIKPLWSPFIDLLKTKRWWVLTMQALIGAALAGIAFSLPTAFWFQATMCFFFLIAFCSATHDISADGFYMIELDEHTQTKFVGLRNTFYRLAIIFVNGFLVMLAGVLQVLFRNQIRFSWALIFYGLAGIFIGLWLYHSRFMPRPKDDVQTDRTVGEVAHELKNMFRTFFVKFGLGETVCVMLFLLLYRFPEALLNTMTKTFILRPNSQGGLGLSPQEYGFANGTVGLIGLLLGGILGGILVSRDGMKKWLWPLVCAILIGVFGVKPPTNVNLDVTAALALMSIILIEGAGIRARGGVGFLKSLAAPTPVMTPMNILEIAIRPTSLCMRLFGNVLGAFVIMELIKLVVPVFVPAVFSLYFDLFDGLIQTYVFVFLTSLFMKETMGGED